MSYYNNTRRNSGFLTLSILVFCASFVFFISVMLRPESAQAASHFSEDSDEISATDQLYGYFAMTYMGKVGIFRVGSDEPFDVLDVWVNDLPEADREQLNAGLFLPSEESLQALVEDYTG